MADADDTFKEIEEESDEEQSSEEASAHEDMWLKENKIKKPKKPIKTITVTAEEYAYLQRVLEENPDLEQEQEDDFLGRALLMYRAHRKQADNPKLMTKGSGDFESLKFSDHNQSRKPGRNQPGSWDKWARAPFPGIFYSKQEFKKLVNRRQEKFGREVDDRTGIPMGEECVPLDFEGDPLFYKDYIDWRDAARSIASGRKWRNPETKEFMPKGSGIGEL